MKAIYINLDPYLAQIAAWIKSGKPGKKPDFQPLPLAVTVPLAQDVVLLSQGDVYGGDPVTYSVDGQTLYASYGASTGTTGVGDTDNAVALGLTHFSASGEKYTPCTLTSDSPTIRLAITNNSDVEIAIPFTVLVRRETASGPVDLVDFTPPAAVTAASINAALGGTGAVDGAPLSGVELGGAVIVTDGEGVATKYTSPGANKNICTNSPSELAEALGWKDVS